MKIIVREYKENDIRKMIQIWNEIVEEGNAFPQEELLTMTTGKDFFAAQTYTGIAVDSETEMIYGLYILHPNNIGRCGHICNASYAVSSESRGLHIGERIRCLKRLPDMRTENRKKKNPTKRNLFWRSWKKRKMKQKQRLVLRKHLIVKRLVYKIGGHDYG